MYLSVLEYRRNVVGSLLREKTSVERSTDFQKFRTRSVCLRMTSTLPLRNVCVRYWKEEDGASSTFRETPWVRIHRWRRDPSWPWRDVEKTVDRYLKDYVIIWRCSEFVFSLWPSSRTMSVCWPCCCIASGLERTNKRTWLVVRRVTPAVLIRRRRRIRTGRCLSVCLSFVTRRVERENLVCIEVEDFFSTGERRLSVDKASSNVWKYWSLSLSSTQNRSVDVVFEERRSLVEQNEVSEEDRAKETSLFLFSRAAIAWRKHSKEANTSTKWSTKQMWHEDDEVWTLRRSFGFNNCSSLSLVLFSLPNTNDARRSYVIECLRYPLESSCECLFFCAAVAKADADAAPLSSVLDNCRLYNGWSFWCSICASLLFVITGGIRLTRFVITDSSSPLLLLLLLFTGVEWSELVSDGFFSWMPNLFATFSLLKEPRLIDCLAQQPEIIHSDTTTKKQKISSEEMRGIWREGEREENRKTTRPWSSLDKRRIDLVIPAHHQRWYSSTRRGKRTSFFPLFLFADTHTQLQKDKERTARAVNHFQSQRFE